MTWQEEVTSRLEKALRKPKLNAVFEHIFTLRVNGPPPVNVFLEIAEAYNCTLSFSTRETEYGCLVRLAFMPRSWPPWWDGMDEIAP